MNKLTDVHKVVNKRIKQLGWSRYKLAQECKGQISDQTVYNFLDGKSVVTNTVMVIVAAARLKFKRVS